MKISRSAKVLIVDGNNDILILRRSTTHPWAAFAPDLPGGIIEDDETFESGVVREIVEETGLVISPDALKLLYTVTDFEDEDESVTRLLYAVHLPEVKPVVMISWEHDQYQWLPITAIKDLEIPNQRGVEYIIEHHLLELV